MARFIRWARRLIRARLSADRAEADLGRVLARWARLIRKNRRLAFKRRCWAALGRLLNDIKAAGRA